VEKLEAVHDAASVGVEIKRFQQDLAQEAPQNRFRLTEKP
jgi:hypothetical protein